MVIDAELIMVFVVSKAFKLMYHVTLYKLLAAIYTQLAGQPKCPREKTQIHMSKNWYGAR